MTETRRQFWHRIAGICWLATAAVYLATEAAAAAAFQGYSYGANYISDLGIPYRSVVDGREIVSPLAGLLNAGMVVQSALFAMAAIAFGLGLRHRSVGYFVMLAAALTDAAGLVLIAMVHSGHREIANGTIVWHMTGAAMSIIGGNITMLAAGLSARRFGLPASYGRLSIGLGLFGLAALAALISKTLPLPPGLLERASVYTITVWQVATAGLMLLGGPGRRVVLVRS